MKRLIFWVGILLFVNVLTAQNQLVVQVLTDKYADETSWKLFDTNKNLIAERTAFSDTAIHADTLILDEANCYFWRIYDNYGDGMDAYGYPGDYKLFFNGAEIASCQDPNFGDSISVYGIGTTCANIDASVNKILLNDSISFSTFQIPFELLNYGSVEINTVEGVFKFDDGEAVAFEVDDLAIQFGKTDTILIPQPVQLLTAGNHTLTIEILSVNESTDEDQLNNLLSYDFYVNNGFWKKPMHEVFTANWCSPCAAANPIIDAVFENHPQEYSLIKYQYINDPYYTPNGGNMASFYSVSGVPDMRINGTYLYPGYYTEELFLSNAKEVSDIDLWLETQAVGDTVFATLQLKTQIEIEKNIFVRVAVVENTTIGNVGSNGEDKFHNVFMRFLTDWRGDDLGTLSPDTPINYELKGSMSFTNVEEMHDLSLVVYAFYDEPYEVIQSEMKAISYAPAAPQITFNIENNAVGIDTNTVIEIQSNKALFDADANEITNFENIIQFEANEEAVGFEASIDETNKIITLTPDKLEPATTYTLDINNMISSEGVGVENVSLKFTTINAASLHKTEAMNIKYFPNPVKNELYISTNCNGVVSIIALDGRLMFTKQINGSTSIDLSTCVPGIYLLEIANETSTITKRIVKN